MAGDRHDQISELLSGGTLPEDVEAVADLGFFEFAEVAVGLGEDGVEGEWGREGVGE